MKSIRLWSLLVIGLVLLVFFTFGDWNNPQIYTPEQTASGKSI